MNSLTTIVRRYNKLVRNGRSQNDILKSMKSEVDELEEEIKNGSIGIDGIVGENIDIIACALDSIFEFAPEITDEQLSEIMEAKCAKWKRKYG